MASRSHPMRPVAPSDCPTPWCCYFLRLPPIIWMGVVASAGRSDADADSYDCVGGVLSVQEAIGVV